MSGLEADLLFSAKVGETDTLFYLLWEHQRTEDPHMSLRLLVYMARIWQKQCENQKSNVRLSPILPLVLAQDKDPWKSSLSFHKMFSFPEKGRELLYSCTPDFAFRLLQLVEIPYQDIRGTPEGILTLRSLKAAPAGELMEDSVWDASLITGISREAVERFFRYVLNANVDKEAFKARVSGLSSKSLTALAMTLAESLRQEGRQEGIQAGAHSLTLATLDVLELRFGAVPEGLAAALSALKDLDRLNALHKAALTCGDFESFATGL